MRLLIVRKPTNFELHGDRVRQNIVRGAWYEQELTRLKASHEQHYQALNRLYAHLKKRHIDYVSITRDEDWQPHGRFDVVIAFGGDGTLLSASHNLDGETKLIGLRSTDASVGYMCAAGASDLEPLVDQLTENRLEFVIVARLMVKVESLGTTRVFTLIPVLNDVLFANCSPAATTHYRIIFNGQEEWHKSSGVWVSTAVGSTAAIQAAGGVGMAIGDRRLQYRVRELYCLPEQQLSLRGQAFDPDRDSLILENRNERALIALDGQHAELFLQFGDRIEFLRAPDLLLAKPQRSPT